MGMSRRRKPHHHEIRLLPFDPSVAFRDMLGLYCRLSDDDPKAVSIEHQIQVGMQHAAQHGKTIVAIYIDWRTGFDPDRLALRQLIEDAHAKKHSGVLFYDHYRFHRGVTGAYPIVMLHTQLPEYTFLAARDGYNIDQVGIWAGISGMEAETTRRRSMEQRRTRAEKGQWMAGMKPYWLDRDANLQAVVATERAAAFLHALQLYVEPTGSAREACAWLSAYAPLDPKRGARKEWTSQRFRNLLRNPALWGELPYARGLDVKDRVDGHFVIRKRVDNPARVTFTVPPLIHRSELERTQCRLGGGCQRDEYPAGDTLTALIKQRDGKQGGRPYEVEHPLRHITLLCACGWRVRWNVRRSGARSYLYVACAARWARGRTLTDSHVPCGMPHLPVNTAVKRTQGGGTPSRVGVWQRTRQCLIDALRDPVGLAEEQRRQVLAEQQVEARNLAEEAQMLDTLDETLAELDERENRLYERYDARGISKNVYETQTARIAGTRRETEERKRQLLAQRLIVQRAEQAAQDLSQALAELGDIDAASFSDNEWARILPDLVEAVVLDVDGDPTIRWHRPS